LLLILDACAPAVIFFLNLSLNPPTLDGTDNRTGREFYHRARGTRKIVEGLATT